jgi:hypothetical protein
MSVAFVASNTVTSFLDYTSKTATTELPLAWEPVCLADYIQAWVVSGDGVRACQGNFETYLVAVVAIINEWIEHPDHTLNYVEYVEEPADEDDRVIERRVSKLFRDDDQHRFILDRDFFTFWAFRALRG